MLVVFKSMNLIAVTRQNWEYIKGEGGPVRDLAEEEKVAVKAEIGSQ